jgi:hypothetical protein
MLAECFGLRNLSLPNPFRFRNKDRTFLRLQIVSLPEAQEKGGVGGFANPFVILQGAGRLSLDSPSICNSRANAMSSF